MIKIIIGVALCQSVLAQQCTSPNFERCLCTTSSPSCPCPALTSTNALNFSSNYQPPHLSKWARLPAVPSELPNLHVLDQLHPVPAFILAQLSHLPSLSCQLPGLLQRRLLALQQRLLSGLLHGLPKLSHRRHQRLHNQLPHIVPEQLLAR